MLFALISLIFISYILSRFDQGRTSEGQLCNASILNPYSGIANGRGAVKLHDPLRKDLFGAPRADPHGFSDALVPVLWLLSGDVAWSITIQAYRG